MWECKQCACACAGAGAGACACERACAGAGAGACMRACVCVCMRVCVCLCTRSCIAGGGGLGVGWGNRGNKRCGGGGRFLVVGSPCLDKLNLLTNDCLLGPMLIWGVEKLRAVGANHPLVTAVSRGK